MKVVSVMQQYMYNIFIENRDKIISNVALSLKLANTVDVE